MGQKYFANFPIFFFQKSKSWKFQIGTLVKNNLILQVKIQLVHNQDSKITFKFWVSKL